MIITAVVVIVVVVGLFTIPQIDSVRLYFAVVYIKYSWDFSGSAFPIWSWSKILGKTPSALKNSLYINTNSGELCRRSSYLSMPKATDTPRMLYTAAELW